MVARLRATSKITPHELDSLLQFVVPPLQIFDDHVLSCELRIVPRERVARTQQQ